MPLPDERPRQSVANLIGKFETHSKHLSPSQSNPSRSSSVVSHVTSDSGKEDIKEKREWPPKPVADTSPPGPYRVMPLTIHPDAKKERTQTKAEAPLMETVVKHLQEQNEPDTFLENWRKDLPQPTAMEPEPATSKPADELRPPPPPAVSVQKIVSASQTPRTPTMKASATKLPASTSSKSVGTSAKAPPKSTWKSTPPRQSLTPASSAQSLKPQLTGQSMVSSTSKKTISRTPIVAKTPTRAETGTKTPTTLSPRSKTPSCGLFAPTAASLARARNAPLPPPPSFKKPTISSDAMDRLSRPTAASLSRVKTGPTQSSPAPTPKSPRISSSKSKSTVSPSKSPQTKVKQDAAVPQSLGGAGVTTTVVGVAAALPEVEAAPQQTPAELTTNGHPANVVAVTETPTASEVEQTHPETATVSGDLVELEVDKEGAPSQTSEAPEAKSEVCDLTNGAEVEEAAPKTSLEDIVYLLETAPAARPSIEEISEIPDEDDK